MTKGETICSMCPCCSSDRLMLVGKIPPAISFAGRTLTKPLDGGNLFRCDSCGLAFRWPRLDKAELDKLYRDGDINNWDSAQENRTDWNYAGECITQYVSTNENILDVGCLDGEFLRSISPRQKLFGIEINEDACLKAKEKGITIIGYDFSKTLEIDYRFGAVTSFDVIEHVHNPLDFLSSLSKLASQKGIIIVSSGNSDAFTWKLAGEKYWYCAIGEHLSFINPRWCKWAAEQLGLDVIHVVKISHIKATLLKKITDAVKNLVYIVMPNVYAFMRKSGMGNSMYRKHHALLKQPPTWMSSKDHFVCVFKKSDEKTQQE